MGLGIAIAGPDDVVRALEALGGPAVVATSVPVPGRPGLLRLQRKAQSSLSGNRAGRHV